MSGVTFNNATHTFDWGEDLRADDEGAREVVDVDGDDANDLSGEAASRQLTGPPRREAFIAVN